MPLLQSSKEISNITLLAIVMDYIDGSTLAQISTNLRDECNRVELSCSEQYEKFILSSDIADKIFKALLIESTQDYNDASNLYILLKKLSVHHSHINDLINLIDTTKLKHNWGLYFTLAAALTSIGSFLYYLKDHSDIVKIWFERLFRALTNTVYILQKIPLVGIAINVIPLSYTWYNAIFDHVKFDTHRGIRLGLNSTQYILPILGYTVCYLAAGIMTVPACALFILGAAIACMENIYIFSKDELTRYYHPQVPAAENDDSIKKMRSEMNIARANSSYYRGHEIFAIKLIASLLIAATVIIWCVFPPSFIISLACVVIAFLVEQAQTAWLGEINTRYFNASQTAVDGIRIKYDQPKYIETNSPYVLALMDKVYKEGYNDGLEMRTRNISFFSSAPLVDKISMTADDDNHECTV